jgi:DNA polymerase III subunit delta
VKFSSTLAFDKHLKEAFPDHLAPIFLLVVSCEYERRKNMDKITALVQKKDPHLRLVRLSGLDSSPEHVKAELLTPSLWGGLTLVVYDAVDKVKNNDVLGDLFAHFPPHVHLILGAASFKPVSELYQKGKKEIVVLDMSDEKPWEKERRLQEWMVAQAKLEQKILSADVAHYLLQHLGPDLATLDQELAKLICYAGDKPRIDLQDAQAICGTRDLFTGWQLAEKIVWERPASLGEKTSDLGFLFPFIGQLRYHLQLGYRLAELVEAKASSGDIKHHLPSLRPQQLEKYSHIIKTRPHRFFQRGLNALYELEFASKSSPLDIGALFDLFQAKLYAHNLPAS